MLEIMIERMKRCESISGLAVATSSGSDDDPIAALCENMGIACYRGDLDDVAGRFVQAAIEAKAQTLVRISGDSPFLDPALIDQAVALFETSRCDLATNILKRSFPKGMSVEVFRAERLREAHPVMSAREREHVTAYFYAHPEEVTFASFESKIAMDSVQLSVDTVEDYHRVQKIARALGPRLITASLVEVMQVYEDRS
ncbi:putative GT [Magnetospira sp. QH-2]|nr:putative GT [Magnetospira sp. QH-2]